MTALTYGHAEIPHDCLAVLPSDKAQRLADEIDRVKACTTVGEARRLAPFLKEVTVPFDFDPDDEDDLPADDEPYDWEETSQVQDGDWPPMPTAAVLSWADPSLLDDIVTRAGARRVTTTFNGDYLDIALAQETNLVSVLADHGHSVVRDDKLIRRLGRE
jgi:hypothetical protein